MWHFVVMGQVIFKFMKSWRIRLENSKKCLVCTDPGLVLSISISEDTVWCHLLQFSISPDEILTINFSIIETHTLSQKHRLLNPLPNRPWCLQVFSTSLLKTLWEKEKLLIKSNFSFSHSLFYPFQEFSAIFIKFKIVVCKLFQFEGI